MEERKCGSGGLAVRVGEMLGERCRGTVSEGEVSSDVGVELLIAPSFATV